MAEYRGKDDLMASAEIISQGCRTDGKEPVAEAEALLALLDMSEMLLEVLVDLRDIEFSKEI